MLEIRLVPRKRSGVPVVILLIEDAAVQAQIGVLFPQLERPLLQAGVRRTFRLHTTRLTDHDPARSIVS
jgi:hypothetical protein